MKNIILSLTLLSLIATPMAHAGEKEAVAKAIEQKKADIVVLQEEYANQKNDTGNTIPILAAIAAVDTLAYATAHKIATTRAARMLGLSGQGKMIKTTALLGAGTAILSGGISAFQLKVSSMHLEKAQADLDTLEDLQKPETATEAK
jgi:hypothetical protein